MTGDHPEFNGLILRGRWDDINGRILERLGTPTNAVVKICIIISAMHPEDDDPKVADYFVVAGLADGSKPQDVELDFLGATQQVNQPRKDPIVDICVIDKTVEESCPQGFTCIEKTPTGILADLNHGSFTAHNIFLCYRRGRDKPPLVDLGVYYEGLENIKNGIQVIRTTASGRSANVNNKSGMGSFPIYLTYRRGDGSAPQSSLVVTDICIIMTNKNEEPPYAYCLINKNLNKGMIGSSVFLCYKKSMRQVHSVTFKPDLLGRYPAEDTVSFPLPASVPLFCLPMGATIECWSDKTKHPLPSFSSFVLTTQTSAKVYGAVISFYESYPENLLQEEHKYVLGLLRADGHRAQGQRTLHTVKAICMLSRWPLFDAFRDFLIFIYRLTVSPIVHTVPIERHIAHFFHRVPFPSPERPRVQYQMSPMHATVLTRPHITPIPLSGASFLSLLDDLGADNTLTLIALALLEHKILVHSLRRSEITRVAEALISLLFPFKWQCTYVPLCPLEMAYVLEAPTPFIVGADSRYFDMCEPPPDVVCVNLDTNAITQRTEKKITWKMLPKRPSKHARSILQGLFNEIKQSNLRMKDDESEYVTLNPEVTITKRHMQIELTIQETVLKLMAVMMNGYRDHLLPLTEAPSIGTTDPKSLFNMHDFVHRQDRSSQRFFSMLTGTQLFAAFIETRSFASLSGGDGGESAGKAASLVFFDECIDRLKGEYMDNVRLIEADDMLSSERTIIVMAPDEKGLPQDVGYRYTTFPQLQEELFSLADEKVRDIGDEIVTHETVSTKKRRRSQSFMVGRRTKQETKVSQKQAKLCSSNGRMWSRLLFSNAYSVWFGCLLDFSRQCHSKASILRTGLDILYLLRDTGCLPLPDETCYRVLMHLCCLYNKPVLAVRAFHFLRDSGTQLSAVTYGLYNKALLECTWPSSDRDGYVLWQKLKNVFLATVYLRRAVRYRHANGASESSDLKDEESSSSEKSTDRFSTFPRAGHSKSRAKSVASETRSLPDTVPSSPDSKEQLPEFLGQGDSVMSKTEKQEAMSTPQLKAVLHDSALSDGINALLENQEVGAGGDGVSQNMETVAEESLQRSPLPRSHSSSIVKPSIGDIEPNNSPDSSRNIENADLNKAETPVDKFRRKSTTKLIIERMDITHLALDPLSPPPVASNLPRKLEQSPPANATDQRNRTRLLTDTPFLFHNSKDDMPIGQFSSLTDIPFAENEDVCGSQTSTPNEVSRKHPNGGLLRRSFSFAPGSNFSGNLLSSGSKINSLLKATTIGVASKAKKLAANLAKDINETVQTNLAYYTPEKFKGSLASLPELSQDQLNDEPLLKQGDHELRGSRSSLHSYSEKQSSRSNSSSLKANSGISYNSTNTSKPTLAMSSNSINSSTKVPIEMEIIMCSCSKCPKCGCSVYDEEIMAGWMADESNLNTHCPFCNSLFVPHLSINLRNYKNRIESRKTSSAESETGTVEADTLSNTSQNSLPKIGGSVIPAHEGHIDLESVSVPYLSPLVLRKELESLLENEGISILGEPDFVDHHSIVYWNFVWCFRRLNLPSSLYNLVLDSALVKSDTGFLQEPLVDYKKNAERVAIHTMWDNIRMHEDLVKPPLYWTYLQTVQDSSSKYQHYSDSFLESIKESIISDDVRTPLLLLLEEYSSHGNSSQVRRSAYRDILFLIITALGKECIDVDAYDRAYKEAYDELSVEELGMTRKCDKPPTNHTRECRNLFGELKLA